MAKHEISIHENTGATKEAAAYLGSYISKETIRMDGFADAVGALAGLPAIQLIAILSGSFEAIEELERDSLTRIHLDGFTVCGVITGSFPTADAAFDPERNALELALRLDDAVRNELADVTPTIISDEKLTKLRVDNVMDLAEERPMNLIHGRHVFRVAGFNMVLTDEGAAAFLQDSHGATFELVVDEVVSKQLFKAHTAALLEPGDYKLVVKSRAGDAEGPLQTSFRKVKYLKVVDPDPVDPPEIYLVQCADEPEGKIHAHGDFTVDGAHLANGALALLDADGHAVAVPTDVVPTDARISARLDYDGDVSLVKTVKVTTPGGTATMNVRVLA